MTLKTYVATRYLTPILLAYVSAVTAISAGKELTWDVLSDKTAPAALLSIICMMIQDFLPRGVKEFLVFWRLRDRLPGHRAYTEVCAGDTRIPTLYIEEIVKKSGELGSQQNSFWYQQYKLVQNEPQVKHENLRYLGWRDSSVVFLVLAIGTIGFGYIEMITMEYAVIISLILGALCMGAISSANNAATSLVRNVVACSSVKENLPRAD